MRRGEWTEYLPVPLGYNRAASLSAHSTGASGLYRQAGPEVREPEVREFEVREFVSSGGIDANHGGFGISDA